VILYLFYLHQFAIEQSDAVPGDRRSVHGGRWRHTGIRDFAPTSIEAEMAHLAGRIIDWMDPDIRVVTNPFYNARAGVLVLQLQLRECQRGASFLIIGVFCLGLVMTSPE
jgi:hypothetical protein